jgi:RecB family exonuclease
LVHRLFEHVGTARGRFENPEAAVERMPLLVGDEEAAQVEDLEEVLRQAGTAYLELCAQSSVSAALDQGESWFEVPFSVRPAGSRTILRGTFDCLVRFPDGRILILEFKTGRPLPQHDEQLAIYLTAARALFPDNAVEGSLVYAPNPKSQIPKPKS